jgi:hypothetical protein
MKISTISALASAAVVTGISTLAFAAPAQATVPEPPGSGSDGTSSFSGPTTQDDGTNWSLIGAEAAGGVAIVGAGAAGVILIRRHHHGHLPHAA